jgi:cell division protein FtsI (penicillin-binding protein 3)
VLALVSLPDFDPHAAGAAKDAARFNRITLGVYELGSVLKIFNHALALDSGRVTMAGGYDASHALRVARFTISDYHGKNRWLSLPEIFMYSSNIASAKMALDIGTEAQRHFFDALGLLRPSPIELPEVGAPMVPSPWREINTMTIGFGHGIAISPLHLAVGAAAVVNGGVLRPPTLLRQTAHVAGTQVTTPNTSEQMRRLLRLVVSHGTGQNASAPGYVVGGKTGTAEKQAGGRYQTDAVISTFVAAFPMTRPRYVVLAMLDEPKGNKESFGYATAGWTAAPAVGRIVARMAPLLGMPPVDEESGAVVDAMSLRINSLDPEVAAF